LALLWFYHNFYVKDFTFAFLNFADENDVSVSSLDEQLEDFTDKEISDFVSFDSYYTCLSYFFVI